MNKFSNYVLSFILLLGSLTAAQANIFDYVTVEKLKNNKEAQSVFITKKDKHKLLEKYPNQELYKKLENLFYASVVKFDQDSNHRCELNLISYFRDALESNELDLANINDYLKLLLINQSIDDILYEFTIGINKDINELNEIDIKYTKSKKRNKSYKKDKLVSNNDLNELYQPFIGSWPDEKNTCLYQEFNYIISNLKDKQSKKEKKLNYKKKIKLMGKLNEASFKSGLITKGAYKKLEYLRKKSFITERMIRLDDYFYIILNAKDKMASGTQQYEIINIEDENDFSTEKMRRFSKLTRRKKLYNKYDPTQIIMLAKVFENASRRAGVDPDIESQAPYIAQEYSYLDDNGKSVTKVEKIILDPQSQYNWARRMMRTEISNLEMMDAFYGKKVFFNEVIMAAFETGYITIEDISYAVQYDDLWNPSKSKFERIIGYIFRATSIATFFLPPPYNIFVPLGISITEGIVDSKLEGGRGNENPATIIN